MSTDPSTASAAGYHPHPDRDSAALVELLFDRLDHNLVRSIASETGRRALGEQMRACYHNLLDVPADLPDHAARYNRRYVLAELALTAPCAAANCQRPAAGRT